MRFQVCVLVCTSVWVLDTWRIGCERHLCALDRALSPMKATPHGVRVCVWVCGSHIGNGEKWHRHSRIFSRPLPCLSRARLKNVCGQRYMCVCVCVCVCAGEVCVSLTATSSLSSATYRENRDGTINQGHTQTHTHTHTHTQHINTRTNSLSHTHTPSLLLFSNYSHSSILHTHTHTHTHTGWHHITHLRDPPPNKNNTWQ